MRLSNSVRWLLLAFLLSVFTVPSQAGVFISVGFAPPALPVYEQPPCPEPGLMWTPGYWAYGDDGYYWVPGTWVPAPYEGALWTPGYWGWSGGLFVFHDGYWGHHVGYYGGVNYGFGYGGIGFAGGEWRGHDFHYNTVIVHVDRRYVHNTFEDRGRVDRSFVSRDSHIAFSGGPGGIRHDPRPEERMAEHEQHMARSSFQMQHEGAARSDRGSYVKFNGGRPDHLAVDRPLGHDQHGWQGDSHSDMRSQPRNDQRPDVRNDSHPQSRDEYRQDRGNDPRSQQRNDYRPDSRNDSRPDRGNDARPQQPRNDYRQGPGNTPQPQPRNDYRQAPRGDYQAPARNDARPGPGNESHATPHPSETPAPRQSAPPPAQHQAPSQPPAQHQAAPPAQHQGAPGGHSGSESHSGGKDEHKHQ